MFMILNAISNIPGGTGSIDRKEKFWIQYSANNENFFSEVVIKLSSIIIAEGSERTHKIYFL